MGGDDKAARDLDTFQRADSSELSSICHLKEQIRDFLIFPPDLPTDQGSHREEHCELSGGKQNSMDSGTSSDWRLQGACA
mmetsp:Transcript_5745/g.13855  ORF Transcript_5745/g.13855 Transcript_5745/m.13855 type:complete len:80 (-) Transcript_5745:209-448(-)